MLDQPDFSKLNTVLFDMDGLLIDSESISLRTFNDTITAFGLPDHNDLFIKLIGRNSVSLTATLTSALANRIDVNAFKNDWNSRYYDIVKNEPVPLKPGVTELLDWLRLRGIKTAVATSSKTSIAQIKLGNAGLLDYFQIIIGGDQVTNSKPDPEIYIKAASAVTADKLNTLVLEDSAFGVQAGVAANIQVIQVPDIVAPSPELLSLGHNVCEDLHEVLTLLTPNIQSTS